MKAVWNSSPVRFIRGIVFTYFDKNVSRASAQLAYFLILTFFPILICINALIGKLNLDPNMVLATIDDLIPKESLDFVGDYITYINTHQSNALLYAGITATILSAAAAVRSLMSIMEEIYGREHYGGIWRFVASLVFSVLMLVTIYLSIAVVLTGNWFFHMLEGLLNIDIFVGAWLWMRFLILLGLVFLFILLLYKVTLPPGRPRPPLFPGAILSAVILVAASVLFSWFMGVSTRYSLIYGSLASVMILLVWLYLCGNIIIMGTVFNYVLFQRDLWAPKKRGRNGPRQSQDHP